MHCFLNEAPYFAQFYVDCYLRFTSDNYDSKDIHNKFSNLTNASINKENIKVKKDQEEDIDIEDKNINNRLLFET